MPNYYIYLVFFLASICSVNLSAYSCTPDSVNCGGFIMFLLSGKAILSLLCVFPNSPGYFCLFYYLAFQVHLLVLKFLWTFLIVQCLISKINLRNIDIFIILSLRSKNTLFFCHSISGKILWGFHLSITYIPIKSVLPGTRYMGEVCVRCGHGKVQASWKFSDDAELNLGPIFAFTSSSPKEDSNCHISESTSPCTNYTLLPAEMARLCVSSFVS